MKSLEELNLSSNDLSRDRSLSDKLATLTSLKILDLSRCDLTEIPQIGGETISFNIITFNIIK